MKMNALIFSAIYGEEKLLQLLGSQDSVRKVGIELLKGQLAIILNMENNRSTEIIIGRL